MRNISIRPDSPALAAAKQRIGQTVAAEWSARDQQTLEALQARQTQVMATRQKELKMLLPSADDSLVASMLSQWDSLRTLFSK